MATNLYKTTLKIYLYSLSGALNNKLIDFRISLNLFYFFILKTDLFIELCNQRVELYTNFEKYASGLNIAPHYSSHTIFELLENRFMKFFDFKGANCQPHIQSFEKYCRGTRHC